MNSSGHKSRINSFADVLKILKIKDFDFENIDKFKQFISYLLKPLWAVILIVMIFLLIPMTPYKLSNGDVAVVGVLQSLNDPLTAALICIGMMSVALNCTLGSYILHQMTYKDVIRIFRKARRKGGLFTIEEEDKIITLINEAKDRSKKAKEERKKKLKDLIEKTYGNEIKQNEIAEDVKTILAENAKLKKKVKEFEDLEKEALENVEKQQREKVVDED